MKPQAHRRAISSALIALAVSVGGALSAAGGAEAQAPAAREAQSVDELLDALEKADVGVRTFSSELIYDRRFKLQGDRHIRFGNLTFRVEPPPSPGLRARRTFAVRFETLMIPDDQGAVRRDDQSVWLFDGQWLIEKREAERQFIKRQIARPGDAVDPLRLGEGPLPIPIGQKKADILERYEATLLPAHEGVASPEELADDPRAAEEAEGFQTFIAGCYQLRLVPLAFRADDDDFREIRLWYLKGSLLPRAARTVNRAGDVSLVLLAGAEVNGPLAPDALNIETPDPQSGWSVQIDEGRFGDEPTPEPREGAGS